MTMINFNPNDRQNELHEQKAALLEQIALLDAREPKNMNSEEYEAWADEHEKLEDLLDEIQDQLDDLED